MKSKDIRVIGVDIDGTLTNGVYYQGNDGSLFKGFYTRDIASLGDAYRNNVLVVVVTQSDGSCIKYKLDFIRAQYNVHVTLIAGVRDKAAAMDRYLKERDLNWDNLAYIGDAKGDLEILKKAEISACPDDAEDVVKEECLFISNQKGGEGAVYEFVWYLFNNNAINYKFDELGNEVMKKQPINSTKNWLR
jgi:YrbI family 3-deoxy-D-manno-octulosonate 8-phosphate phosphatase